MHRDIFRLYAKDPGFSELKEILEQNAEDWPQVGDPTFFFSIETQWERNRGRRISEEMEESVVDSLWRSETKYIGVFFEGAEGDTQHVILHDVDVPVLKTFVADFEDAFYASRALLLLVVAFCLELGLAVTSMVVGYRLERRKR